jgi:hypothetical protein
MEFKARFSDQLNKFNLGLDLAWGMLIHALDDDVTVAVMIAESMFHGAAKYIEQQEEKFANENNATEAEAKEAITQKLLDSIREFYENGGTSGGPCRECPIRILKEGD